MAQPWPLLIPLDQLKEHSSGSSIGLATDGRSILMFSKIKSIIKSIRNMRTVYNVKAAHKVHATVYVPGGEVGEELLAELQREVRMVAILAKVDPQVRACVCVFLCACFCVCACACV